MTYGHRLNGWAWVGLPDLFYQATQTIVFFFPKSTNYVIEPRNKGLFWHQALAQYETEVLHFTIAEFN